MKKICSVLCCLISAAAFAGVMEVNDSNFAQEVEKSSQPVVVDVYATWCGPCKQMGPVFVALSSQFPDVKFVKMDFDKTKEAAKKYGVSSLPTFLFFKDGQEVGREMGMMNQDALASKIKQRFK